MKLKRIGCYILAVVLSLPLALPINSWAAGKFTDTAGHWAERYINTAVSKNIITGYPDGRFLPDQAVTRAEFATMVNKALGNTGSENLTFRDVPYGEWYYNDVAKAVAAAYTAGYNDNTFRPNNPISRQEAAVMIARFVPAYGERGDLRTYSDHSSVADWAYAAMEKVNGKGYIGAYTDGNIHPADQLTRAQTAKILCDIINNETIVTGTTTLDGDGDKLSGKIYSNKVNIDADLGEGSAIIDNSVILGTLSVKGGGIDSITINNSRVANVTVNKDNSPVRVLAKGETAIVRLSAYQSSILQTASLKGGLFGPGFSNVTVNSSAEATLRGSFPNVTVSGSKAELILDTGSIGTLTVSGRYSNITAESGTTIDTATVNAESYFHDSGTISQMNVNADGITYETKPRHWTIKSSVDTPTLVDATPEITFSPKSGATNVKLDTKITITFDSAMEMYDGSSISNADISDFVELRKSSTSGSRVGYSASINSAKTIITITPDSALAADTKYYVIIGKDSVRDGGGNGNTAQSVYFTTGNDYGIVTTAYSPADGAATVPVNTNITITFSDDVVKYSDGASISTSDSYLKDSVVLRKINSSGALVPFSATINSSKTVITVNPDSDLTLNQKYYVAVVGNKLKTKDGGEAIPSSSVAWTTGYTTPAFNSFSVSPGDTSITATVTPNVVGKVYAVAVAAGSAAPSAAQIAAGQNNSGFPAFAAAKNENVSASVSVTLPVLGGLASGNAYDVWATLYSNASGTYSTPVKQTTTTTLPRITLNALSVKPVVNGIVKDDQISFLPASYNYSVGLNDSISTVELQAQGDPAATITLTGNGLGTVSGMGAVNATVDIAANPSLSITISAAGSTSSTYTVSLGSVNDTSLRVLKLNSDSLAVGGSNFSYAMGVSGSAVVSLEVETKDAFAETDAPSGIGVDVQEVLSGLGGASFLLTLPEGSDPVAVEFHVRSGSADAPYYITFTRP